MCYVMIYGAYVGLNLLCCAARVVSWVEAEEGHQANDTVFSHFVNPRYQRTAFLPMVIGQSRGTAVGRVVSNLPLHETSFLYLLMICGSSLVILNLMEKVQ